MILKNMKHYQKTKTSKRIKNSRVYITALALVGAALLFVAPLLHIYLPKKNPVVEQYKKDLKVKVNKIDNQIASTKASFNKGEITGDVAYSRIFNELLPLRERQVQRNDDLIKVKTDEERKFGWKTWRAFANGWGQRLPYLVLILAFSLLFFSRTYTDRYVFWTLIGFQLIGYTVTMYQQVYSFWPGQDLPLKTYRWLIISISAVCGATILYFLNNYKFKIERLQEISRNWIRFAYRMDKNENVIIPSKTSFYRKERGMLVKQSIDNE